MFDTEVRINRFLLQYARKLTDDVADERFAEQPLPGVNHPAWILGHLALSGDSLARAFGGEKTCPEIWAKQFGQGSVLTTVRTDYPSKQELITTLESVYQRAHELAPTANAEDLARPNPNRVLRGALPTVGDGCAFGLTGHFSLHLGQLSTWRRMIGLAALF